MWDCVLSKTIRVRHVNTHVNALFDFNRLVSCIISINCWLIQYSVV
jgi:hypothetical protein